MIKLSKFSCFFNYLIVFGARIREVIYFSKEIDVRANWDVDQIFDLSIPYNPESDKKTDKKKTDKKK
ncbi:hypothetical protein [Flavobacterium sp. AJR]|uniref:hypothetical protein n=1 Tax=Flavobacterium sp. AJR TaxID=1979369 RepID=UPI000A3D775F|nr:hypothetical protein [Flavobacterium sp. AJR]OUL63955.1 hypothetical protein B8T70_02305 [Flavobacterium sp. AJR]